MCYLSILAAKNIRPSKKKKNMFLVRISIKKRAGSFFVIYMYYFLLHPIFTQLPNPPGALRSNISKLIHTRG